MEYGGRPRVFSIVNGASFWESGLAPGTFATAFGTRYAARVIGAGDSQVNFLVPGEVRWGGGRVEVEGAGLEWVRFVLPEGVSLRGAVPVWVRIEEWESNRLVVRMR